MNARSVCQGCLVGTLVALASSFGLGKALFAQPAPTDAEQEVLTRGPVHEAFAETVTYDPEPGIVSPKAPPEPIEEIPPEQRLEGPNVAWIPGYWAWDDERSDFLWVSGIWRALPPGRQWVPGYWGKCEEGFQWTSGYWADAQDGEVEYLPEPPDSVEIGPNVAAPSPDDIWLPGNWVWHNSRYAWRPGYWAPVQPNWVWIPAHYVWTPGGYVFVGGYWDYAVGRRGVLFAPVYFAGGVYARPGFLYSPSIVIDPGIFASHLFWRPRYRHYYFGDYYAVSYHSAGYLPWFAINTGRFGYDPIFAHDCWLHRADRDWAHHQQVAFELRRDHEDARPPRTWAIQRTLDVHEAPGGGRGLPIALSLDELRKGKDSPLQFKPLDLSERKQFGQHGLEMQKFREERQKLEVKTGTIPSQSQIKALTTSKVKLPKTSIVAKSVTELGKDHAPPTTFQAPKLDLKIEPKARVKQTVEPSLQRNVNPQVLDLQKTQKQLPPKTERMLPQSSVKDPAGLKLDQFQKKDQIKDQTKIKTIDKTKDKDKSRDKDKNKK